MFWKHLLQETKLGFFFNFSFVSGYLKFLYQAVGFKYLTLMGGKLKSRTKVQFN